MRTQFHETVQSILEGALRLPSDARESFIRQACRSDPQMLQEALSLLPHYAHMTSAPTDAGTTQRLPPSWVAPVHEPGNKRTAEHTPPNIEQYHLREIIGCGGMGVVYRAEHAKLRRSFAVKILQTGFLSQAGRQRFAFEVEVLRKLQHAGIARLIYADHVRTASGTQPYFVMEYVRGRPLTRYARDNNLDIQERLLLFAEICKVVAYAHDRGVIHRDLKPDNILVTASGRPKILDFGIARLYDYQFPLLPNENGQFLGTPKYASPEQAARRCDALKPASDVYTLGLILHELLTGHLPQGACGRRRLLLDELDAQAARNDELRFRLAAILVSALACSALQRYPSAGQLGSEIEALLDRGAARSGWTALKDGLFGHPRNGSRAPANHLRRPLHALMRLRISRALQFDGASGARPRRSGR